MYEEFYGLTEKPFSIQPDPSFLYWGRGHRLAYAMLEYGVVNQAGISVITGEVGCGKTTLIHRLLDQLSDTHTIALLSNIQAGRGDLLSWVLMAFGEPFSGKTHVEMFSQLQSFFIREYAKGKRVVLIIDEAQNLSADMLEELRMLSNINAGKDQLLQLILVGQPQLKDLLSRPDMLQLAQRIGSDFHLTPLTRDEVHAYIETRLSIAGAQVNVFTREAMDLIAEHSRGVPRVINTIADTALVYAFSAQEETVSDEIIRNVIRDKLDYGVFGLASSPTLKLEETDARRPASGFISDDARVRPASISMSVNQSYSPAGDRKKRAAGDQKADNQAARSTRDAAEPALMSASPTYEAPPGKPVQKAAATEEAPPHRADAPAAADTTIDQIGVVIIHADGDLEQTLRAVPAGAPTVVVAVAGVIDAVDAHGAGIDLVEVDANGFSGGRARNAGYRRLKKVAPALRFVQFMESGVELETDWLMSAARFMARRPEVAALEGQTATRDGDRKRFFASGAADDAGEGEVQATGSNAFFRADAFEAAGGFRGDIIADETADLCIRLRRRGAHAWRNDFLMAAIPQADASFSAWRERAVEDGFRYAAGAALHGGRPERYRAREQARAVIWGAVFPVAIFVSAIAGGVAMFIMSDEVNPFVFSLSILAAGILLYGLKIATGAIKDGFFRPSSWVRAAAATIRHFHEYSGVSRYWFTSKKDANARKAVV